MADKTSGKNTVMRQWHMLRMIPRQGKVTVQQLRDRLARDGYEATERTIQRDLLEFCGLFPLQLDDRDRPYGWSWDKNARAFDLPGLTVSEAITLALVEQHLHFLLPASALEQLKPQFRAARERLNHEPKPRGTKSWLDKVRAVPPVQPLLAPKIDPAVQDAISQALLEERQVAIHYRKRGTSKAEEYHLHPLALVQRGTLIYLYCRLFDYKEPRTLAMHRIVDARVLDERTKYPADFSIDKTIEQGVWGFGAGKSIKLELLFDPKSAEHLYETPLSNDQTIDELPDKRCRVVATVVDTPQLRWWLRAFAESVEVVRPIELRKAMAESSRRLAAHYADSAGAT